MQKKLEIKSLLIKNKFLQKIICLLLNLFCFYHNKRNFFLANNRGGVLIIALHKLGDSILAANAIKVIQKHYGKKVSLACLDEIYDVYNLVFSEINLIKIPSSEFYFGQRIATRKARKLIKKMKSEVIVDLTGSITSASLIFNSQAKKIIGINDPMFKKLYNEFVPIRTKPHLADIYLDVAKRIAGEFRLPNALLTEKFSSDGYVVIHPFAGWPAKAWGLKKFIEIAEILNTRIKCIMVFPSNQVVKDVTDELAVKNISFKVTKTIADLIAIIKKCSAFVGNDSGPLHLANLFCKPTFSIFGPTNPKYHLPLTGINKYFSKRINCSPKESEKLCFTNGGRNGCPSFECMENISVKDIERELIEFLNSIPLENKFSKV